MDFACAGDQDAADDLAEIVVAMALSIVKGELAGISVFMSVITPFCHTKAPPSKSASDERPTTGPRC